MREFDEFVEIVKKLCAPDGCPWDSTQTHTSLKPTVIEEASEVVCGINLLEETGNGDSLCEELGDLLMQVVIHAVIAEKEGLFTIEDVADGIKNKMIRRHPHVFGEEMAAKAAGVPIEEVKTSWDEIKKQEKAGREWMDEKLPEAFAESKELIDRAMKRKGFI